MAHEIETMAYVGATPWHGLGNPLTPNRPIEIWMREAGMDWQIEEADVLYNAANDQSLLIKPYADNKVLYRSDSHAPLSVVSKRYQVVQPREVLEFYRDLVAVSGFQLETAGVLKGGRKFWALAKTGQEFLLPGDDQIKGYLLLATSCDGTLATTAQFTSVRVVCNNTLQLAVGHRGGAVRVSHATRFDAALVKQALGIGVSAWDAFIGNIRTLAKRQVTQKEANQFLVEVLGDPEPLSTQQTAPRALQTIRNLFEGEGRGSQLKSAEGTAWGLLNGVTEYVDHFRRARNQDFRLDSAWFGMGATIKERAYHAAMKLAA